MNFIPSESALQFSTDCGVNEQVYEYFLAEWGVKPTVKWVSEQGSVQRLQYEKQECQNPPTPLIPTQESRVLSPAEI